MDVLVQWLLPVAKTVGAAHALLDDANALQSTDDARAVAPMSEAYQRVQERAIAQFETTIIKSLLAPYVGYTRLDGLLPLLFVGPAQSGRTSVLRHCCYQLRTRRPGGLSYSIYWLSGTSLEHLVAAALQFRVDTQDAPDTSVPVLVMDGDVVLRAHANHLRQLLTTLVQCLGVHKLVLLAASHSATDLPKVLVSSDGGFANTLPPFQSHSRCSVGLLDSTSGLLAAVEAADVGVNDTQTLRTALQRVGASRNPMTAHSLAVALRKSSTQQRAADSSAPKYLVLSHAPLSIIPYRAVPEAVLKTMRTSGSIVGKRVLLSTAAPPDIAGMSVSVMARTGTNSGSLMNTELYETLLPRSPNMETFLDASSLRVALDSHAIHAPGHLIVVWETDIHVGNSEDAGRTGGEMKTVMAAVTLQKLKDHHSTAAVSAAGIPWWDVNWEAADPNALAQSLVTVSAAWEAKRSAHLLLDTEPKESTLQYCLHRLLKFQMTVFWSTLTEDGKGDWTTLEPLPVDMDWEYWRTNVIDPWRPTFDVPVTLLLHVDTTPKPVVVGSPPAVLPDFTNPASIIQAATSVSCAPWHMKGRPNTPSHAYRLQKRISIDSENWMQLVRDGGKMSYDDNHGVFGVLGDYATDTVSLPHLFPASAEPSTQLIWTMSRAAEPGMPGLLVSKALTDDQLRAILPRPLDIDRAVAALTL